ncbi:hypothetical protein [Micromonospora sp. IBHARD004]|uniref:hypothetical protein n=1 Tax=Micromonospora sp. IBHARD004 TaxID=3457764 RepID=UPI00405A2CFC
MPLYIPTSVLTLRPASTTELRFDLDLRALSDGSNKLRTLLDLTEELWSETRLTGPFLMAPQADPARPVLALQGLGGARLRLLD